MEFFGLEITEKNFFGFGRGKIVKYLLSENGDNAEKFVVFRRRHH